MSTYINLMSHRARVRECIRSRLRQWLCLLAATLAVVMLHAFVSWLPVHSSSLHRDALEARYEPYRQMKLENRQLTQQIADAKGNNKLELELTKETPVLTLVGLVSQAVSETDGNIFLKHINFSQEGSPTNRNANDVEQVALSGLGTDSVTVQRFSERLKTVLPFAKVQIRQTESVEVGDHAMQSFQIQCTL